MPWAAASKKLVAAAIKRICSILSGKGVDKGVFRGGGGGSPQKNDNRCRARNIGIRRHSPEKRSAGTFLEKEERKEKSELLHKNRAAYPEEKSVEGREEILTVAGVGRVFQLSQEKAGGLAREDNRFSGYKERKNTASL